MISKLELSAVGRQRTRIHAHAERAGRWPAHQPRRLSMSYEKLCPVHRGLIATSEGLEVRSWPDYDSGGGRTRRFFESKSFFKCGFRILRLFLTRGGFPRLLRKITFRLRRSVAWQAFHYRKALPLFLFRNRWLQTAFAICRIAREISESSSMSEAAV